MALTISISDELKNIAERKARSRTISIAAYIRQLILDDNPGESISQLESAVETK